MDIAHDSVNRFLLRESYKPQDLFNEAQKLFDLVGGTLNVDDTTLDKPYSQKMVLVGHFWSGKHHRVVKGLRPAFATGDSWYACEKNLKMVKNHPMVLMFAVESNRTVSLEKGAWVQVQSKRLAMPSCDWKESGQT